MSDAGHKRLAQVDPNGRWHCRAARHSEQSRGAGLSTVQTDPLAEAFTTGCHLGTWSVSERLSSILPHEIINEDGPNRGILVII